MSSMHSPSRHLLLLTSYALFATSVARAQQDPTTAQGLTPYGSFHGGDIDSVILINGKLNLHIPLISYPQRGGKLHAGFFVSYPNPSFSVQKVCAGYPTTCKTFWSFGGTGVQISTDLDITLSSTLDNNGVNHYLAVTPDGSQHQMESTSDGLLSLDATGFHYDSTAQILIDRDGIRYSGTTNPGGVGGHTRIEDPNGNLLTLTPNGSAWTDTLGRVLPVPPSEFGGGTQTTDFSGCAGPLATYAAYLWTPPGVSGGTATFKACVAQVQVNYPTSGCSPSFNCYPVNRKVLMIQSIVLPNGTAWTFQYNGTGDLIEIDFPTGGSITYAGWGNLGPICSGTVAGSIYYRGAAAGRSTPPTELEATLGPIPRPASTRARNGM